MKSPVQVETRPPAGSPAGGVTTLNITVLSGGPSDEREVSLASGQAVFEALRQRGHRVTLQDIGPDDLSALEIPADVIFIALHGAFGEDGTVQRILEERGMVFCGADATASALAMNKVATKLRLLEHDLPTPTFDVATPARIHQVVSRWRTPAVVKPVDSGSSVDTHVVRHAGGLRQAVEQVVRTHGEALIEEFVEGPELTVGILGSTPLPVCQIRTRREFYDYQAKYIDDDTEYLFQIDLPPRLLDSVQAMSVAAVRAIGCRDLARVDWMVDEVTHQPAILEINTIPGFTSHSLVPKAAARIGLSFGDLCQRIVDLAMQRAKAG